LTEAISEGIGQIALAGNAQELMFGPINIICSDLPVHFCLPLDQPHAFQLEQHLMRAIVDVDIFCFNAQFGGFGDVIGV
jgi:hypothetical protein